MKLLRVHIISARTCGGLLDGFNRSFRMSDAQFNCFDPLCLVGPNGSGKSQLMQVLAEVFQSVCHAVVPEEERLEANPDNLFEVEYLIRPDGCSEPVHVMVSRNVTTKGRKSVLSVRRKTSDGWVDCDLKNKSTGAFLPRRIVGYTSGDNETLSLPFLVSRSGYAEDVRDAARNESTRGNAVADTRLMLIDYGTNLEVLVANLLFGTDEQRVSLLEAARVSRLHSCRCIVQLNHAAVTNEVLLTDELADYLEKLKRCSTSHLFEEQSKTYTFDFWINEETRKAFRHYWANALELYHAFHKLAMLNDLAIPKKTRQRVRKETRERHFAARLPEPADEDKVFRFEQVKFISRVDQNAVDYVSLSDGEHQLCQLLGMMMMQGASGVMFLLDEPESHFNPQWRVRFISKIMELPTNRGHRGDDTSAVAEQECMLTTHAPFVPSDMARERVFIFAKVDGKAVVENPNIETYGATFDSIVAECFGVVPPISKFSLAEIETLKKSTNVDDLRKAIKRLGHSVQKALLVERLTQLQEESGA